MQRGARRFYLDVCDYDNNAVCNLYDNQSDISGQATDVTVHTERNGWKELSFVIPSTCQTDEGEEENYRLKYLIADYRLRVKTDNETDYYLISEPRITHNGFSKNIEVTAGHISQLLKTKNLNLEFSDEEGNNVGTAAQLLETILEGTGWSVGTVEQFLEDDGETVKVRSLVASTKTGAFSLIASMCENFDAKPIYHGDTKTVDIVALNPFSEIEGATIPQEVLDGKQVIELHYGKNVGNITRTLNTENLVTRLYAYGAYGDKTTGLCSLQTVEHSELTFVVSQEYEAGTEFKFVDPFKASRYFIVDTSIGTEDVLIWSDLDPVSRSYVWNDTKKCLYKVHNEPINDEWEILESETESVPNRFDYLMDFSYYEKIGLLSDNMLLELAKHQRNMPSLIEASTAASTAYLTSELELSRIAESNTGFLKLDVRGYDLESNELVLLLNQQVYPDGVEYRSDYDEARRNYFSWYCAESLKENGDPVYNLGSVVYIVHDTDPITWDKAYIKEIDGKIKTQDYSAYDATDPSSITLWLMKSKVPEWSSTDRFYLFSTNSISGRLGVRESEIESLQQTLDQATKIVTEKHPTYFVWDSDPAPTLDVVKTGYCWYYRSHSDNNNLGDLYFCYGAAGENAWHRAFIEESDPTVSNGDYYFNLKTKKLFHGENGTWVNIADTGIIITGSVSDLPPYYAPDKEAQRLSQSFSKVAYYCLRHDMLYKGVYDKYIYTPQADLIPGNYAFKSEYGFYWVFTTDSTISANNSLWLDTVKYLVFQNEDIANVVTPEVKPYETIIFPSANELEGVTIQDGSINKTNGVEENSTTKKRTYNISVYGDVNYTYDLPACFVAFYDTNKRFLDTIDINTPGTLKTPTRAKYARFVFDSEPTNAHYFQVTDYANKMFIKETLYTVLSPLTTDGSKTGINMLMKAFADTADQCYTEYLKNFQLAQKAIKESDDGLKDTLQDLYREGYWQENEYVEGDEDKLYKDALDNLKKIAKPEATYDVQYLDLYASNHDLGYSVDESLENVEWPDTDISDAVHLIDEDIDVNCWAFIDKLDKCYDQPWKTQIVINTDLSLIGQHSFTDVLSRIAEVASETNAKQTIYQRAAAISSSGGYAADKLTGTININNTLLNGGASGFRTDSKGRMIFESADGQSAMMLTGYGWAISTGKDSDGDWIFNYTATGQGMTADFLTAGEIDAQLLVAGSITTDKLHASIGQELDIGSNKALMLYATTDGFRPSGGLKTPVVQEGDSYIEIAAKQNNVPAYIDVMSGGQINIKSNGKLNLEGAEVNLSASGGSNSVMNLKSGSLMNLSAATMNVKAGSALNIRSGALNITTWTESGRSVQGQINVQAKNGINISSENGINVASGGSVNIASGGSFTVASNNFSITETGNVSLKGTIEAAAGKIAGFTISGVRNPADTDWIRQFIYCRGMDAVTASGNGIYIGTDGLNLGGKLKYQIITNQNPTSTTLDVEANSVNIGTSGSLLSMNASNQTVTLSSGVLRIQGSSAVSISSGRTVSIGATNKEFTIGSDNSKAYIRNGMTSFSDTTNNGIYLGTDGIALGKGLFNVTKAGVLTAKNATIRGSITAFSGNIGGTYSNGSITGGWTIESNKLHSGDNNTYVELNSDSTNDYAFWAGNTISRNASFSVTKAGILSATGAKISGTLTAIDGQIGGWKIDTNKLTSNNETIGLSSATGASNVAFWAGAPVVNKAAKVANAPFRVTNSGILTANGATLQSAIIYGTINAGSGNIGGTINGTTIAGGWTIQQDRLFSGSTTSRVELNSASTNNYAFWAGSETPANAPFSVTKAGILTATGANLSTAIVSGTITAGAGSVIGGWSIGANTLSSGTGTGYVALSSDTNSDYAFWAGNTSASSAPFSVKRNGDVHVGNGTFDGVITAGAGSTIGGWYITSDSIRSRNATYDGKTGMASTTNDDAIAFWAGASVVEGVADVANAPFRVTAGGNAHLAGTIEAEDGSIGGWIISKNRLSAGSGNTYVALDTSVPPDTGSTDYAIWAGNATPDNAKFSITKAGDFRIKGGGLVQIEADQDDSYIRFGGSNDNPNFILGKGGNIIAKSGTFDQLQIQGSEIMKAPVESGTSMIYVGREQPQNLNNYLWIIPQNEGPVVQRSYQESNLNVALLGTNVSVDVNLTRSGSQLDPNLYPDVKYGVKFRIYNYGGTQRYTLIKVAIKKQGSTDSPVVIYKSNTHKQVYQNDSLWIDTLNDPFESSNLTDAQNITATITVSKGTETTSYASKISGEMVIQCSANSSSSVSTCEIKWVGSTSTNT